MISSIKGLTSFSVSFELQRQHIMQVSLCHSLATSRQIEKSWKVNTGVLKLELLSGTTTNTLRSSVAVHLACPLFLKGELIKKMSNVSPFNTSK